MKTLRRRRKEAKTDYKARFHLLKSEKARLVIRKSNRYLVVQIVQSDVAQDKVISSFSSRDLVEKGWPKDKTGSLKSLAAAYLSGFALAKQSKFKDELVCDIGMHRSTSGARVFAALKGAVDGGLKVSHKSESLPSLEMIKSSKSTSGIFDKVKEKI